VELDVLALVEGSDRWWWSGLVEKWSIIP